MNKEQREKWGELHDGVMLECLRVTGLLGQLTPISGDYKELLNELNILTEVANTAGCYVPYASDEVPCNVVPFVSVTDTKGSTESDSSTTVTVVPDEPVVMETFRPEPVADPEPVETKALTKEYVRSLLQEKAASGVVIEPFIAALVPEGKPVKLSSIKQADYGKLVEALNNA